MKIWEIWKYALGSFSDDKTAPYDDFITIVQFNSSISVFFFVQICLYLELKCLFLKLKNIIMFQFSELEIDILSKNA